MEIRSAPLSISASAYLMLFSVKKAEEFVDYSRRLFERPIKRRCFNKRSGKA